VEFKDVATLLAFFTELLSMPKLLAFARPTSVFKKYGNYNEVKRMAELLRFKHSYSSTPERLQLFLSLSGDFATRAARPPVVAEDDDDTPQPPLFETHFLNPIPSLFTLATLATVDVSVDPVASMVAEYVATSGRYGIIPPTAPPPTPPKRPMLMPSIFATMQSPREVNEETAVPFDPYCADIQQFSAQVAAALQKSQGKLDIGGAGDLWRNPRSLMVFQPMNS
jgi:hypothetical protein